MDEAKVDGSLAPGVCPYFDHHTPALSGDDFYPLYAELREGGICHSDLYGGFWIVSRFEDARRVLRDHETFSSAQGCFLPDSGFRSLGHESDPPEHGPYRDLYLPLAGRSAVSRATPLLREMTERIVTEFAQRGGGDAVVEICERFPVEGISLMAGLPPAKAARIRDMTVEAWKRKATDPEWLAPLTELLLEEVDSRRAEGGEDYFAFMSGAEVDGRPVTDEEIGNVLVSGIVAGHETTMNASSNLIFELASDPSRQDQLRQEPKLISAAVEECLRRRAPVHLFFRTVTRDVDLAGTEMRPGDKVAVIFAAANRDPDQFEQPDSFRLDRGGAGHLAFGWGIHRCVGAPLAQTELRLLAEELLAHGRFELTASPTPGRLEGGHHMGWRRLPIAFARN